MYNIPQHQTGVRLFNRAGEYRRYASLQAACDDLGYWWICEHVGPAFAVGSFWNSRPPVDWVMRTDVGDVLTAVDFQPFRPAARLSRYYGRPDYCGYGPVPGVHRHRGGRYFRRLRTMNERRASALVLQEEGEVLFRAKRSPWNLPNSWDDYTISARDDRSWKRHRKTQWKA